MSSKKFGILAAILLVSVWVNFVTPVVASENPSGK